MSSSLARLHGNILDVLNSSSSNVRPRWHNSFKSFFSGIALWPPGLLPAKCTESMSYNTKSRIKFNYDRKGIDQSIVKENTRIGVSDMRHISL